LLRYSLSNNRNHYDGKTLIANGSASRGTSDIHDDLQSRQISQGALRVVAHCGQPDGTGEICFIQRIRHFGRVGRQTLPSPLFDLSSGQNYSAARIDARESIEYSTAVERPRPVRQASHRTKGAAGGAVPVCTRGARVLTNRQGRHGCATAVFHECPPLPVRRRILGDNGEPDRIHNTRPT